jgi:hypothetical protein
MWAAWFVAPDIEARTTAFQSSLKDQALRLNEVVGSFHLGA